MTNDKTDYTRQIISADSEFSLMSEREGMVKAFLAYADESAVLLRANSMPVEGKTKISALYENVKPETFTLTWMPLHAEASESGDLGYSYGTWKLVPKSDTLAVSEGTYATVWKRQADGSWKWSLDTGNDGLKK